MRIKKSYDLNVNYKEIDSKNIIGDEMMIDINN